MLPVADSVSLFTREWIEIQYRRVAVQSVMVSLFTREWIEIASAVDRQYSKKGLPLYEGVD